MAEIKEKTAVATASTDTYFGAAQYYLDTNRDLNQALVWANKVVDKSTEYWTYHLRAKIEAKLGNCKAARADAQMSLDLAKKAGDDAYIKNNEKILEDCKM
jgi:predicted RNA polymerase sigma factor